MKYKSIRLSEKQISWLCFALRDLTAHDLLPEDRKIIDSILDKLRRSKNEIL